jgi:hypothetical protein
MLELSMTKHIRYDYRKSVRNTSLSKSSQAHFLHNPVELLRILKISKRGLEPQRQGK